MRQNNWQTDEYAHCEDCIPSRKSSSFAIAARDDLNDPAGTVKDPATRYRLRGAVDVKVTSGQLVKSMQMIAESGPTSQGQKPFKWTGAKGAELIDHEGQPDSWNFKPVVTEWKDERFPDFKFDY